ncbi:hypothetical protein [Aegicerativicinus sediminis]|uniref:hypothetical protein n=1 Tax=Aegicerativicinus sediminis TaxID=2893202 RepID=UPI001E613FA2|nr:hypothetical protein [Aegicerativicinus sediminis]
MSDVEFIKKTSSDVLVKNHLKLVFDTYYNLFGEVCTSCTSKIGGYINRIKNYNQTAMAKTKKSEFVLKAGSQIVVRGRAESYSNANLTDEIALKYIKANPNRKVLFAKLPKNIDELLAPDDLSELTVKELKAKYPDASGKTKAELIENIKETISAKQASADAEETDENGSGKASDEEE